jgi:protein-disulfide isomerase
MKRETLANTATGVLVLCALTVTALVVRRDLFSPAAGEARAASPVRVSNWRDYGSGGHVAGPANAPVSVVVFSDFQCPACRMLADSLAELRRRHPAEVRVVYRHFPLPGHPFAADAARASECAAAQGRFQPFHDALFARQEEIGATSWAVFAGRAGLADVPRFEACTRENGGAAAVMRDQAMARRLGVDRTPTLLVNDLRSVGARPVAALEEIVQRAR